MRIKNKYQLWISGFGVYYETTNKKDILKKYTAYCRLEQFAHCYIKVMCNGKMIKENIT